MIAWTTVLLFAARPSLRVVAGVGALGVGALALGAKGFTPEGLPFSSTKNLTGTTGKVVGGFCFLLALLLLGLAAWMALGS